MKLLKLKMNERSLKFSFSRLKPMTDKDQNLNLSPKTRINDYLFWNCIFDLIMTLELCMLTREYLHAETAPALHDADKQVIRTALRTGSCVYTTIYAWHIYVCDGVYAAKLYKWATKATAALLTRNSSRQQLHHENPHGMSRRPASLFCTKKIENLVL